MMMMMMMMTLGYFFYKYHTFVITPQLFNLIRFHYDFTEIEKHLRNSS